MKQPIRPVQRFSGYDVNWTGWRVQWWSERKLARPTVLDPGTALESWR
jgi:hypothetical protein